MLLYYKSRPNVQELLGARLSLGQALKRLISMFEQLFGSKTRVKLMRVFLDNPEKKFFVRELTRLTDMLINSVRRELQNLLSLKLIKIQEVKDRKTRPKGLNTKRYYYLNVNSVFRADLNSLFSKGKILVEKKFLTILKRLGNISYLSLMGFFLDDPTAATDVLVVGEFDRAKAIATLNRFEKQIGHAVRYTLMNEDEFKLRQDIADKFLEDILSVDKKMIIVNKLIKE